MFNSEVYIRLNMKRKTELIEIVKRLEGLQTAESAAKALSVKKRTAVNILSKLRKKGFVKYYSAGRKKRIYKISAINPKFAEYPSMYDIINKHSKIKAAEPARHIIHGKKPTIEEAIIFALKSQNFRLILASLSLFAYIKNWSMLNGLAKKNKAQRQVGALHELSRLFIKARKIDKRTKDSMLKGKGSKYIYGKIKTKEFFDIAKKWRVEIPFKKQDLIRLKTG